MASVLLIESRFDEEHPRFLDDLFEARDTGPLRGFARRWATDARPWARRRLHEYIDDGCDRPGHRAFVKALYKAVEATGDDALVGRFLVVFDRWARRVLADVIRWDWETRATYQDVELRWDRSVPGSPARAEREGRFSRATRRYLARRALRYLRRLGYHEPDRFRAAAVATLRRYDDEHLQAAEHLLDAWGLHHLLYHGSPVLDRQPECTVVATGRALGELAPAPLHPAVWQGEAGRAALLDLLATAEAAVVRGWALALLRGDHREALAALDAAAVRTLLHSPHEEAQQLGAELLPALPGLERLPIDRWLDLLGARGTVAVQAVVPLAERHVDPSRVSLAECVRLARLPAAPVAELGLRWARSKRVDGPDALAALMPLTGARVESVRAAAADWLADLLRTSPLATPEHLRDLIDAPHADVRARGLALLDEPRYGAAEQVWLAMTETPFADVRGRLLVHLKAWRPGLDTERRLWADTLLALEGGAAARGRALRQIGSRLEAHPEEAPSLLRLLAVSLRGVSAPDRRQALAALGRAVLRRPALRAAVAEHLPEVGLFPEAA